MSSSIFLYLSLLFSLSPLHPLSLFFIYFSSLSPSFLSLFFIYFSSIFFINFLLSLHSLSLSFFHSLLFLSALSASLSPLFAPHPLSPFICFSFTLSPHYLLLFYSLSPLSASLLLSLPIICFVFTLSPLYLLFLFISFIYFSSLFFIHFPYLFFIYSPSLSPSSAFPPLLFLHFLSRSSFSLSFIFSSHTALLFLLLFQPFYQ